MTQPSPGAATAVASGRTDPADGAVQQRAGEASTAGSVCIVVTAVGTPKPKGSLRHVGNGRMVEQVKGSDKWRKTIAAAARAVVGDAEPLTGPIRVDLTIRCERPKSCPKRVWPVTRSSGDIDKHARQALDSLTGIVWVDDSQVVSLHVRKGYVADASTVGCRIEIWPLP